MAERSRRGRIHDVRGVSRLLDTTERIIGYKVKKYGIDSERFRTK